MMEPSKEAPKESSEARLQESPSQMAAEAAEAAEAARKIQALQQEIGKAFVGQEQLLQHLMITLLAGGHLLVEGVPGLGKTLMVRALAKAVGGESKRVQFTPDLMPSDITGHSMYDYSSSRFITRRGPVFTNLLIADEINRAPAKTQAALFEAMQEYQVSIDGETYLLPRPFLTLATQNPYEHEGTYPLPDAQKDRFLLKTVIDYPSSGEEADMVEQVTSGRSGEDLSSLLEQLKPVCSLEELSRLQERTASVRADRAVIDYAVRLAQGTRTAAALQSGAGPRASLALIRAGKGRALLEERNFLLPDDIKALAAPVLRHRVIPSPENQMEGISTDTLIDALVQQTEAPRR